MKRRQLTDVRQVAKNVGQIGKFAVKEASTVARIVGSTLEPPFSRRHRRRTLHLKRIADHEKRALEANKERLAIERDREAMRFKNVVVERDRGKLLDHMKPSEDLKMALARVAATRKRELDLEAFRARRQRDVDERPAPGRGRQTPSGSAAGDGARDLGADADSRGSARARAQVSSKRRTSTSRPRRSSAT